MAPRHFSPCWLTASLLALLLSGVSGVARAQAPPDTTAARPVEAAPPDPVQPQRPAAPDTAGRAFVSADSLSALVREGERVQDLFGNVFVRQDTTRLRSDYARRYLTRDTFLFADNVVIYERGDTLRADTVRYDKATKVGRAVGNVRLTDGEVTVRAPRATYDANAKRAVFPDSITLVDSNRVLRAQQGTYWSDEKRAEFQGRVRLTDPKTYLESDSLTYYRDTERSIAVGDVFIRRGGAPGEVARDTARTYLFGDWVDNQEQRRYSRVRGRSLLLRVRVDSVGVPADTLIVRSRRLDAYRSDTHRRLVAVDSVRIWQNDLSATADSVVYDRVLAPGSPDTSAAPAPLPDTAHTPSRAPMMLAEETPDSLSALTAQAATDTTAQLPASPNPTLVDTVATDTTAADTTRNGSSAQPNATAARSDTTARPFRREVQETGRVPGPATTWGRPTVDTAAALPLEETRLFRTPNVWFENAQVRGDSIRVRARSRSPDTVFVRGSAFAARRDTALDRINQLKGRTLTAFFRADTLQRIEAEPNAEAIYFLAEDDSSLSGAVRASGDRVALYFQRGRVRKTTFDGGVEGKGYTKPGSIPDPFRLEGFQWTPKRRPTRRGLLRGNRVRRRLSPPVGPVPQVARRGSTSVVADTLALQGRSGSGSDARARLPSAPPARPDTASARPARPLPSDTAQAAPASPPDTTRTPQVPP